MRYNAIALCTEMYGFPLTIYLLTGWLEIEIPWPHQSGHLWAALFGWGDLGAMIEMLVGYTVVFIGISLLIEGWREVYLATQEGCLATDGLYTLFTLDSHRAYVSLKDENNVAVVDTVQRKKIVTIAVRGNPIQVFAMPDGHYVYIANQGLVTNPDNPVSVIDTAKTERL